MCFTCSHKLLASFVSLKVILSSDYLYIHARVDVGQYRCRTFPDGGESNRKFISTISFVKISVIFNARSQFLTQSRSVKKTELTILILPLRSLITKARIWLR